MTLRDRPRPGPDARRVPRALHPIAWWIWAVALAVAVNRTTNPCCCCSSWPCSASSSRIAAPTRRGPARSSTTWRSALLVIVLRVVFRSIFALRHHTGPTTCCSACRTSRRRPGTRASNSAARSRSRRPCRRRLDGLRLGTLICCIGAANALANPKRALRVLPGALYELGMAVVVSISVAPQLVESVQRVSRARRLRAGRNKGFRALRSHRDPGARGRPGTFAAAGARRWIRGATVGPAAAAGAAVGSPAPS